MKGSLIEQETIWLIVVCEVGTAGLSQQEGGLASNLFTCLCISMICGARSTILP